MVAIVVTYLSTFSLLSPLLVFALAVVMDRLVTLFLSVWIGVLMVIQYDVLGATVKT